MLCTCITIPASLFLYTVKILLLSGTAESSEKFTCSISEDTKGAEVTANSTTPLKSPPLEEVVPDHDYEKEPLTAITSIYSMPVVSPAIPPPLPPRPPTVLHRKRAEPNDLLDKTQTSIITGKLMITTIATCSYKRLRLTQPCRCCTHA